MLIHRILLTAASAAGMLAVAACGGGDSAAPPEPGEGARGMVGVDNAGAAQNPQTPALSGGPEGQTPNWSEPGGAPSSSRSAPNGTPPSVNSDNPHVDR